MKKTERLWDDLYYMEDKLYRHDFPVIIGIQSHWPDEEMYYFLGELKRVIMDIRD